MCQFHLDYFLWDNFKISLRLSPEFWQQTCKTATNKQQQTNRKLLGFSTLRLTWRWENEDSEGSCDFSQSHSPLAVEPGFRSRAVSPSSSFCSAAYSWVSGQPKPCSLGRSSTTCSMTHTRTSEGKPSSLGVVLSFRNQKSSPNLENLVNICSFLSFWNLSYSSCLSWRISKSKRLSKSKYKILYEFP